MLAVGRKYFYAPLNALEIIPWVFHKHFVFRQSAHHVRINKLCFTVLKPGPGRAEALRANATENIHSYRKPCRRCPDPVPTQHYLIVEMYKKSQRESCQNIFVLKWIISQCNSDSRVESAAGLVCLSVVFVCLTASLSTVSTYLLLLAIIGTEAYFTFTGIYLQSTLEKRN